MRSTRDAETVKKQLAGLKEASRDRQKSLHLMPLIIDAVRARATVGEIADALASNWGYYRPRV